MKRGFVSDNCAGAHPEVLRSLLACNEGHVPSYGNDARCAAASLAFARLFEREVPVLFVFNGTGANVLSLASIVRPFESVLCADCAHICVDETGAPERVLSAKLQGIPSPDGKLTPRDVEPLLSVQGNPHHAQPRVLSLTNVTEWGTVYRPDEVRALCDVAHARGLLVHMDGARIANAAVACGCTMAETTWQAGLDVLSFGGVKNGTMFGEAVVFFNESLAEHAQYLRKNVTQLQSKMRYIGAQFEALLTDDLWKRNATHANEMARKVECVVRQWPQIRLLHPVDANMLFLDMPPAWAEAVSAHGFGSVLGGPVRMVTAWDTEDEEIDALAEVLRQVAATSPAS